MVFANNKGIKMMNEKGGILFIVFLVTVVFCAFLFFVIGNNIGMQDAAQNCTRHFENMQYKEVMVLCHDIVNGVR